MHIICHTRILYKNLIILGCMHIGCTRNNLQFTILFKFLPVSRLVIKLWQHIILCLMNWFDILPWLYLKLQDMKESYMYYRNCSFCFPYDTCRTNLRKIKYKFVFLFVRTCINALKRSVVGKVKSYKIQNLILLLVLKWTVSMIFILV